MYKLLKSRPPHPNGDEENANLLEAGKSKPQPIFQPSVPYDPDLYPPDIFLCEQHAKARRVSFPKHIVDKMEGKPLGTNEDAVDVCDCCGYPIENQLIPLTTSPKDLVFLGPGFPLFFNFMKYGIGILLIILMIAGLYNFVTNLESTDCNADLEILGKKCEPDYFTQTSLLNKAFHPGFLRAQEVLNLLSVLLTIIFMQVHRYRQRKLAFECDLNIVTASDYTLQIDNLPQNLNEHALKEFLESLPLKKKEQIRVVKINLSYYIHDFMNLLHEHTKLSDSLIMLRKLQEEIQRKDPGNTAELNRLQKIESKTTEDIRILENQLEMSKRTFKTSCVFTGTAFVSFATPFQAQLVKNFFKLSFLEKMKRSFDKKFKKESKFLFQGQEIHVFRAPEPDILLWENLGVPIHYRIKKMVLNGFLTFLSLFLSFLLILGIYNIQISVHNSDESQFIKSVVSYSGCVFIIIINNLLGWIIKFFTQAERHENLTDYDTSLMRKRTAALFLNSAMIYIIVAILSNSFFGSNGLIYNIASVFASNMIMQPLLSLLSPWYLYKQYKIKKMREDPRFYSLPQHQANTLFEASSFDLTFCYASVLNVMLFAAFFAPILPLGLILGITTLVIFYWTFKYILLRRSCMPPFLGKEIAYEAIEIMEFVPLFLGLGDIFFNLIFYQETGFITYVTLGVCIFNFMFPMAWLNKELMPFEEKKKSRLNSPTNYIEYAVARVEFNEEYDRCNPVTEEQATKEWVAFIEKRDDERQEKPKRKGYGMTDKKRNHIEHEDLHEIKMEDEFQQLRNYARSTNKKGFRGKGLRIYKT